ncbi:MAG: ArnT family glycosyltransferase, partial [Betaproteobacteria bacterium]
MAAPNGDAEAAAPARPGTVAEANASPAALWAYRLFPLALLPTMLFLSRDFGITWDEKTHQMYGEAVWQFVTERADSHWFHDWYMYLHGGLFDALCVAAQRLLPGDPWTIRHYVNALFGWLGVVYLGRLGRLLAGPATGLLAMALLTLSPRYLADSMNNPKDTPFAALATVALYYVFRLRPSFPFLGLREFVPLALSIALALDVRAGALLLLAYVAVALAGLTLAARELSPRRLAVTAGSWIALAIVVLLVGTLAWPWAQVQPLKRPFEALQRLSAFDWDRTVLFDGADVRATALPLDYVPRWAAVTTPPVVLVGAAASLLLLLRRSRTGRWRVLGLWAAALFPAAYVVVSRATIYDGIRHLLFAYPPLVVLAACGWDGLLHGAARGRRLAATCVLAAGLLEPAWFCWRNHPNECVYFNLLAGGPRGALGRYELDYWGNSVHQAVAWIAAARPDGEHVVVSGHPPQVVRDEARRLPGL